MSTPSTEPMRKRDEVVEYLRQLLRLLLIAAPWVFGFARGGAETWIPVVLGAGVVAAARQVCSVSALTPRMRDVRSISCPCALHLVVSAPTAAAAATAPPTMGTRPPAITSSSCHG